MSVGLIKSNRWMVSTIICCVLVVAILLSAGVALANGQANITLGEVYQILFYKISHGLVGDLSGISDANINIVWFVRAPRVLLSIFCGDGVSDQRGSDAGSGPKSAGRSIYPRDLFRRILRGDLCHLSRFWRLGASLAAGLIVWRLCRSGDCDYFGAAACQYRWENDFHKTCAVGDDRQCLMQLCFKLDHLSG